MIAAGLLLRSFWDLFKVTPGFNPSSVMAIETWLPIPNDPKTDIYSTATHEAVMLREVLRRNRTLPGVEETAVGDRTALPLGHGKDDLNLFPLIREGQDVQGSQPPLIDTAIVSPEYFHLLGMTLVRGRLFVDQDLEDTPSIAVINQAAARTYWPENSSCAKRSPPSHAREIGIRMALGAQKGELRWMFVRSALALTGIGVLIGLGAAAAIAQLMRTLLFGVSPLDPLSFAVVPLILVLAAALASFLPASRATAINPVGALKAE